MDLMQWIYDTSDAVLPVVVTVVGIFVVLGVCTRFGRLRSLSQMTGFDFGVNVAIGSIIAAVVLSPDPSLFRASVALAAIFALQVVWSWLRRHIPVITNPSSQRPHVLWAGGEFIDAHMRATNYTKSDVFYAMRKSGIVSFDQVRFVTAEPTGDVVVFTTDTPDISREIFEPVVGSERLR